YQQVITGYDVLISCTKNACDFIAMGDQPLEFLPEGNKVKSTRTVHLLIDQEASDTLKQDLSSLHSDLADDSELGKAVLQKTSGSIWGYRGAGTGTFVPLMALIRSGWCKQVDVHGQPVDPVKAASTTGSEPLLPAKKAKEEVKPKGVGLLGFGSSRKQERRDRRDRRESKSDSKDSKRDGRDGKRDGKDSRRDSKQDGKEGRDSKDGRDGKNSRSRSSRSRGKMLRRLLIDLDEDNRSEADAREARLKQEMYLMLLAQHAGKMCIKM
ncbi:hypothetical protein CYMTET_50771, partial [Cymbomonas tetramitiformis]